MSDNSAIIVSSQSNESFIEISNNIIYNNSNNPGGYALIITMDAGIIDYNWIYNFGTNFVIITGGLYVLDDFDNSYYNVVDIDPLIRIFHNSSLDIDNISNYRVLDNSRCFGTGINYENVGIDKNSPEVYATIVDTFYDVPNITNIPDINFIGTVFIDDADTVNSRYNKSYEVENDHYRNQFDWGPDDIMEDSDFPFWRTNDFYNQDIVYVIKNRKDLEPFDNIFCPANPGYGFPEYKDYETGLFGYPRIDYLNECGMFLNSRITEDEVRRVIEDDTIRIIEDD